VVSEKVALPATRFRRACGEEIDHKPMLPASPIQ
jgi:hypothetical protein